MYDMVCSRMTSSNGLTVLQGFDNRRVTEQQSEEPRGSLATSRPGSSLHQPTVAIWQATDGAHRTETTSSRVSMTPDFLVWDSRLFSSSCPGWHPTT